VQRLVLSLRWLVGVGALVAAAIPIAPAVASADPRLDVGPGALRASLQCPSHFAHPHRNPVLLVHGTGLNADESWDWNYELALPPSGFDWCAVTLPDRALGDIQVSSEYVVYAIERIHALTHRQLTVITHSQGGMEGRWAVRWFSRAREDTADLIDLASPNHGIYAADACAGSGNCWPAVWQMASASHFLKALNSVSETPAPTAYTQIYSQTDELVEPSTTPPLTGGANSSNVAIQSTCPGRVVHHAGLLSDPVVWELALDAMTHVGPANPGRIDHGACLQAMMPYATAPGVLEGNAFLYGSAAIAFFDHSGVTAEPALKPYARRYG
jgi:triacylglycerol esterase/lipase EstA (alpha/beta hydrolase family)